MEDELNDPEVVAEVTKSFQDYNAALSKGEVAALNRFFWDSPLTVRFGHGENLFGHAEIAAFRSGRWTGGGGPERLLERLSVTTLGRNFATTNAVFRTPGRAGLNRQSQTWARRPEGWRIIAAHVSTLIELPTG